MESRQEMIDILTEYGHSPAYALMIAIDCERNNPYDIRWFEMVKNSLSKGGSVE